jgi:hypothetical protein
MPDETMRSSEDEALWVRVICPSGPRRCPRCIAIISPGNETWDLNMPERHWYFESDLDVYATLEMTKGGSNNAVHPRSSPAPVVRSRMTFSW